MQPQSSRQHAFVRSASALCIAGVALAWSTVPAISADDTYPARPVRLVVPFPAGGPTDVVGRLYAEKLTTLWDKQVVVDSRPGASGVIGADIVAKSTAFHVDQMDRLLVKAIAKPDFSVVEILSPCYINFGRLNRQGSQIEMMRQFRQMGVAVDRWQKMTEEERAGRFPLGVLVDKELPRYLDSYKQVCETAAKLRAEGKI